MTPEERDEKIVGILTKICINVLVKEAIGKTELGFAVAFQHRTRNPKPREHLPLQRNRRGAVVNLA